ncbi:hypothetical protein PMIN01_07716 [Paraphaeosphaeria minitans]|uniref:Uncharacterized protein n=1 Tax=Paraphaeosphaeria minitans TaxID=565426 RepID=A0A9P6KPL4_9PLEO|nr:hypothetical protein PMIN01_07716 [Paraphaeosphaeria minitans]
MLRGAVAPAQQQEGARAASPPPPPPRILPDNQQHTSKPITRPPPLPALSGPGECGGPGGGKSNLRTATPLCCFSVHSARSPATASAVRHRVKTATASPCARIMASSVSSPLHAAAAVSARTSASGMRHPDPESAHESVRKVLKPTCPPYTGCLLAARLRCSWSEHQRDLPAVGLNTAGSRSDAPMRLMKAESSVFTMSKHAASSLRKFHLLPLPLLLLLLPDYPARYRPRFALAPREQFSSDDTCFGRIRDCSAAFGVSTDLCKVPLTNLGLETPPIALSASVLAHSADEAATPQIPHSGSGELRRLCNHVRSPGAPFADPVV